MTELVQLERRHDDFTRRNTRVLVVSLDSPDDSKKTQAEFPHLTVLADQKRSLSEAAGLIHPHAAPDGRRRRCTHHDSRGPLWRRALVVSFAVSDRKPALAGRGIRTD